MVLKKHTAILFAAALCIPTIARAELGTCTEEEKDDLLALLDEQTELATKTRLNADYVPGMMSVLRGRDLELRGVRTVWEALSLVPGIERSMESSGRRKLLVRGLGNVWGSGNVKLLLNNVAMNTAERGLSDPVLNIPIEQVDRIEVVRGPGSAVHGEFAYLGVINIITRREEGRIFAFGGSDNTAGAGAVASWSQGNTHVSASFSGWQTDGAQITAGRDLLYQIGLSDASNAPGHSNEAVEARTGILRLDRGDFTLLMQWTDDGLGDHFGINNVLPPDDNRIVERNRHRTIEARNVVPFGKQLSAEFFLGWQDAFVERKRMYLTPAEYHGAPDTAPNLYLSSRYLEQKFYGGTDITWRPNAQHSLLLGLQATDVLVRENESRFNMATDGSLVDEMIEWNIGVREGTDRSITSVTLQDEFRITDAFTLTTGLRYDDYDDTGARTTPRIAGVWRMNDRHILKAQYAEAFRPPTLFEVANAGSEKLDAAGIRTYELEYIHKRERWESRITGFYSELEDLLVIDIDNPAQAGYGNDAATVRGVEWEQRHNVSPRLLIDGNVSYLETHDDTSDRDFPGAPHWLANLGATYRGPKAVIWGAQVHHVGETERELADPRDVLEGYTIMDLTATLTGLYPGASLSIGVKNVFDADVLYPAGLDYTEDPSGIFTYPGDYPRAGRAWWARLAYEF